MQNYFKEEKMHSAFLLGIYNNLGIVFCSLVGYPPFSDEREDMNLNKQIIGGHYSFPSEYYIDISNDGNNTLT